MKLINEKLGINPLPWWALDQPEIADDPYHQGYYARAEGKPDEPSAEKEWRDGWEASDFDIKEEITCEASPADMTSGKT